MKEQTVVFQKLGWRAFEKPLEFTNRINMEGLGMNGIILYQSKYGATQKYAQWLSEKTGFPCVETKQARISDVREYDTILLGGGDLCIGYRRFIFLKEKLQRLAGQENRRILCGGFPIRGKSLSGDRRPEHEGCAVGYPLLLLPGRMGYGDDEHH